MAIQIATYWRKYLVNVITTFKTHSAFLFCSCPATLLLFQADETVQNSLVQRMEEEHQRRKNLLEIPQDAECPTYYLAQWAYDITLESFEIGTAELIVLADVVQVRTVSHSLS